MSEIYTLVQCDEDGDVSIECMTKELLLKRLDEEYYGPIQFWAIPPTSDIQVWGGKALLIKGKIVTPFSEETVTKHAVE